MKFSGPGMRPGPYFLGSGTAGFLKLVSHSPRISPADNFTQGRQQAVHFFGGVVVDEADAQKPPDFSTSRCSVKLRA